MTNAQSQSTNPPTSMKIISVFFEIIWYLCWVALALSLALLVLVSTTDFRVRYMRLPIAVDCRETPLIASFGEDPRPGSLAIKGFSDLVVDSRGVQGQSYLLLIPTSLAVGLLWVVFQLRRFLRTVRRGTPFIRENPRTLRKIGYAVVAAGPVIGILSAVYGNIFVHMVDFPGAEVNVPVDVHPFVMFLGLVIIVIAQVFDYGVKLQAEQDLTV